MEEVLAHVLNLEGNPSFAVGDGDKDEPPHRVLINLEVEPKDGRNTKFTYKPFRKSKTTPEVM